jgi:large subunit ribosomal protein L33
MREIIYLACEECKRKNYVSRKNKRQNPEKLALKKFCRFCGGHREHKEAK